MSGIRGFVTQVLTGVTRIMGGSAGPLPGATQVVTPQGSSAAPAGTVVLAPAQCVAPMAPQEPHLTLIRDAIATVTNIGGRGTQQDVVLTPLTLPTTFQVEEHSRLLFSQLAETFLAQDKRGGATVALAVVQRVDAKNIHLTTATLGDAFVATLRPGPGVFSGLLRSTVHSLGDSDTQREIERLARARDYESPLRRHTDGLCQLTLDNYPLFVAASLGDPDAPGMIRTPNITATRIELAQNMHLMVGTDGFETHPDNLTTYAHILSQHRSDLTGAATQISRYFESHPQANPWDNLALTLVNLSRMPIGQPVLVGVLDGHRPDGYEAAVFYANQIEAYFKQHGAQALPGR